MSAVDLVNLFKNTVFILIVSIVTMGEQKRQCTAAIIIIIIIITLGELTVSWCLLMTRMLLSRAFTAASHSKRTNAFVSAVPI